MSAACWHGGTGGGGSDGQERWGEEGMQSPCGFSFVPSSFIELDRMCRLHSHHRSFPLMPDEMFVSRSFLRRQYIVLPGEEQLLRHYREDIKR